MKTKTLLSIVIIFCSLIQSFAQTIDAGGGHSMMLCPNGTIRVTGSNSAGQLGNGTTVYEYSPIEVIGLADIVSVQGGASHSLALKSDGTVWSWGNNTSGQLGDNSTTQSLIPIQVPGLSNVVKIRAGASHNVAIESDSTAWIWGNNQVNQINATSTDKLFPISTGANIVDIVVGSSYTSKLFNDSTVRIVSNGTKFMNISGVISLGSGYDHTFMIKSDSSVWAWGDNAFGQLGDGTTISQGTTTAIQITGLNDVISIAGGNRHSMALKSDGTVWTWGWNGVGQLGNNTLADELTPIQVTGLDSVIQISAGYQHCIVMRSDSTIWGWGDNTAGQLGNDTATNTMIPVQMMLDCGFFTCPAPQLYQGTSTAVCEGDSAVVSGNYQSTAGVYDDSLTTNQGCDSIIQNTLIVNPLPTVSFTTLDSLYCINQSPVTLTGSPVGGGFSGVNVSGNVFTPYTIGTFTIIYFYTDSIGCGDVQEQTVTVDNCIGIDKGQSRDFTIYPNPSTGIINLKSTEEVQIINAIGKVIHKTTNNTVDLSQFGSGIYFIKSGSVVKKVVVLNY